jgi:hypothetical protein
MADHAYRLRAPGGWLLAVAGIGFFLAGAIHPQGTHEPGFTAAMAALLASPAWAVAHWIALPTLVLLVWGLWLLADAGWTAASTVAHAGCRLAMAGGLLMSMEVAVEIAARGASAAYAAGQVVPLVALMDPLQAIGWPALCVGLLLVAIGVPGSAPRPVVAIGAVGALAMSLAGILVQGLHVLVLGPLFLGGNLLAIWIVWAGVRLARETQPAPAAGAGA